MGLLGVMPRPNSAGNPTPVIRGGLPVSFSPVITIWLATKMKRIITYSVLRTCLRVDSGA